MGKFAMSCPKCGNYVTAYNGLRGFIQNTIHCECGCEIDVRAERMSAVECPHCGNSVIYDQGKKIASCPVCKHEIEAGTSRKMSSFHCPQCGIGLSALESTRRHFCPVCDYDIDVQKAISKEKISNEGVISVIKYEGGNSDIVWKHPIEDFRTGSQLIVHESQEAIFFRDGQAMDSFSIAGRYTLETQNLPLMDDIYKVPAGGANLFHSEVYYINKAQIMNIKWGTSEKIRVTDPESLLVLEIGASGDFNIVVSDARRLLFNLVGTKKSLTRDELLLSGPTGSGPFSVGEESFNGNGRVRKKGYFHDLIMSKLKSYLARTIREKGIPMRFVDGYLDILGGEFKTILDEELEYFGLSVSKFNVSRVTLPDNNPDWKEFIKQKGQDTIRVGIEEIRRKEALAKGERKKVEAQTARDIRVIEATGEMEAGLIKEKGKAEAELMHSQVKAQEMQMMGYTYNDETTRIVGLESMKNGLGGTGGIDGGANIIGQALNVGFGIAGAKTAMDTGQSLMEDFINGRSQRKDTPVQPQKDTFMQSKSAVLWKCKCGNENTGKFCNECGAPRFIEKKSWKCPNCGNENNGKFCSECGQAKPVEKETWDCVRCGTVGNTGKFCCECGMKKPEPRTTWDCPVCGRKDIDDKFCNECGTPRTN